MLTKAILLTFLACTSSVFALAIDNAFTVCEDKYQSAPCTFESITDTCEVFPFTVTGPPYTLFAKGNRANKACYRVLTDSAGLRDFGQS
jgi:hypothetical protein